MDIEKLLQYAAIDAEYVALNRQYNDEPDVKAFKTMKKSVEDATELITRLNAEAEGIIAQIGVYQERFVELQTTLSENQQSVEQIEDEKEADFYAKNVEKLIATLNALSGDIATLGKRIADIRQQTVKASAVINESKEKGPAIAKAKAEVDTRFSPLVAAVKARLKAAGQGLESELAIYQTLRKNGVKRPICAVNAGEYCGGCAVWLDANTRTNIAKQGYELCPKCGRILYVEKT